VSSPNRPVIPYLTQCMVTDEFVDLIARPPSRIRKPLDQ
jgi:hypothetical protein